MKNLQIKYAELFTLAVAQLFYRNQICKTYRISPDLDLDIVPIAETKEVMKRMDLVFRQIPERGGIIILGRVQGKNTSGDDVIRFPPNNTDKLTFGLVLRNAAIFTQNDLPLPTPEHVYYFSNGLTDALASRDALHLNVNAGGVSESDLLKIAAADYRYQASTTVAADAVVVRHQLTGKTVAPALLSNQGGGTEIAFNLLPLPSGKCELLIESVVTEVFYYSGNALMPSLFGVVEVFLSSAVDSNYRVIEPDRSLTLQRPAYQIIFKNRQTVWRYTFQLYPNSPLYLEIAALSPAEKIVFMEKLNVFSNDTAISFKQTHTTDTVIIFESVSPVLLSETYHVATAPAVPLKLALGKNIGEPNESTVKDNLPYPSTKLVDTSNPSVDYSDIFITI